MRFLQRLAILFVAASVVAPAQNPTAPSSPANHAEDAAPTVKRNSSIALLPGYEIQIVPGIDTAGGTIWKDGGPTIYLAFCCYAHDEAASAKKSQVLWRQEQTIGKLHFVCVYTKSNEIFVSSYGSSRTSFSAKIGNRQELAEVLLMALSLDDEHGYVIDPGAIVPYPKTPVAQ
jgi:hypothetical protein